MPYGICILITIERLLINHKLLIILGFDLDPAHRVVEEGDDVAGYAGHDRVYQTGHHERVVQQVLADDGRSRAVEVHRGDIRGIVGDEEVTVDRGQNTQQNPAVDAESIGQRQHGNHNGTLGVDEYRHEEEGKGNRPRVLLNKAG